MTGGGAVERTLLLVGCGKMGSALLAGWLDRRAASRVFVVEPEGVPAGFAPAANLAFCRGPEALPPRLKPDAVVFAVKPQVIDSVLAGYRAWVDPPTVFLSIVAGKTLAGIERRLGPAALVRTMPNLPAAIGRGFTVACPTPRVTADQKLLCEALLAAVGESAWVEDEGLLDAVTAVSGSGPAYVFLLIEALARAGENEGLAADLALRLARATVAGAGELARRSEASPAQLRRDVTSPGGTTEAALALLMAEDGLEALIGRAVAAAAARSRALAG
jgi:pyrroline-5-carboxylate reductase